jgi:CTP:molybdopterin cytidylyltransferase MocA
MAKLIRMDQTGHTLLAEWAAGDATSAEAAVTAFREQLDEGYYAVVTRGEGHAEQVRELPAGDDVTVILRRPIAGGC